MSMSVTYARIAEGAAVKHRSLPYAIVYQQPLHR